MLHTMNYSQISRRFVVLCLGWTPFNCCPCPCHWYCSVTWPCMSGVYGCKSNMECLLEVQNGNCFQRDVVFVLACNSLPHCVGDNVPEVDGIKSQDSPSPFTFTSISATHYCHPYYCEVNPPLTREFPCKGPAKAESRSIWWCYHATQNISYRPYPWWSHNARKGIVNIMV